MTLDYWARGKDIHLPPPRLNTALYTSMSIEYISIYVCVCMYINIIDLPATEQRTKAAPVTLVKWFYTIERNYNQLNNSNIKQQRPPFAIKPQPIGFYEPISDARLD